jgi:hypothetical protein
MQKPPRPKPPQAKDEVLTVSTPTITSVGVVLNKNNTKSNNRAKTSRLFIKGTNFDSTSGLLQVSIDDPANNWICFAKAQDSTHITCRVKFDSPRTTFLGETGNITVTVTNGDGGQATSTPLTMFIVDEDELV